MVDRPKLEIVRTDDGVSFYLNGKCLDETTPDRNPCYAAESIAKELARALGADVDEVADPAPQPYTYFVAYTVFRTGWRAAFSGSGQIHASHWFTLDGGIDGPEDTQKIAAVIAEGFPYPVIVTITGFEFIDGPC